MLIVKKGVLHAIKQLCNKIYNHNYSRSHFHLIKKKKKPIQEVSSGRYWPDISHIDLGVKCLAQIFLYFELSRLHVTKVK